MSRQLIVVLLALLFGCGKSSPPARTVGVDTDWRVLDLDGRQSSLTGFTTELLQEIGRAEKINFTKVTVSWDNLLPDLIAKKYEAILFSMNPYVFNQQQFDFSDLCLKTGLVLVVPTASKVSSLKMLSGKEIAVMPDTSGALILEKYPGILIRSYGSIPQALNDIIAGAIDGALVDILTASAYCQDIYKNELKIATPPLDETGLRLITLHRTAPDLIEGFNEGLEKLKANGTYEALLQKWGLKVY